MSAWIQRRLWPATLKSLSEWDRHDGYLLSAALAYYASLSLFPLCLILTAALGHLSRLSPALENQQAQLIATVERNASPWLAAQLQSILAGIKTQATIGGPLGLVSLLLAAIGVFVQLDNTFARIWGVPLSPTKGVAAALHTVLYDRLVAFLMLLGVGGLVVVVFILNLVLAALRPFVLHWLGGDNLWQLVQFLVTVCLNAILFTLLYKTLPKRHVRWGSAITGAVFTTTTWHCGQRLLVSFVISDRYSAYGVIGSFLAVMLWVYYASAVVFFGAELVRALDTSDVHSNWPPNNHSPER